MSNNFLLKKLIFCISLEFFGKITKYCNFLELKTDYSIWYQLDDIDILGKHISFR